MNKFNILIFLFALLVTHLISSEEAYIKFSSCLHLFKYYLIDFFTRGGDCPDNDPLKDEGVPLTGFRPGNKRCFKYHPSKEDTSNKIDQREPEFNTSAILSSIYLIDRYAL